VYGNSIGHGMQNLATTWVGPWAMDWSGGVMSTQRVLI
jgi:hypothetical protein